jgi:alanine-glyoxylate transaminase/serine-glyoxylate transaminase/serine-pyruvate transaminase
MVLSALAGVEMTLRDVGIAVRAGAGVAAAEEYYRDRAESIAPRRSVAAAE